MNIKRTSSLLIAFVMQIACLTAVEQLCSPSGTCYSYSEEEGSKIILIGNQHDEQSMNFEIQVLTEALKKNIVALQESLSNDKAAIINIARQLGFKRPGYLLGMEDPLANFFTDLIHDYGLMHAVVTEPDAWPPEWTERSLNKKGQLLTQFKMDPTAKKLWRQFKKSSYSTNLSNNVISIVDELIKSKQPIPVAKQRAFLKLSKDENQWLGLFKHLGVYVLEEYIMKLPEDKRLDADMIRKHLLEDPLENEGIVYIRFDVNTYWRNFFIKDNIKKTFAFAQKVNKPLFIIIGQDHFKDIEAFIKTEGYPLESYSFDYFYTEELARQVLEQSKNEL